MVLNSFRFELIYISSPHCGDVYLPCFPIYVNTGLKKSLKLIYCVFIIILYSALLSYGKTHTIIEIVGQSHAPWVEIISMSGSYVKVGSVVALPTFTFFTPSIRSPHRYPEIAQ